MSSWNLRQIRVFRRYSRIYGVPLTPEVVTRIATRYAEKHRAERPVGRRREAPRPASTPARVAVARRA